MCSKGAESPIEQSQRGPPSSIKYLDDTLLQKYVQQLRVQLLHDHLMF